ncbi:HET-domain-containing protein [Pilatotrama ljubarskyi]|nr:HET-domain-containing protein [Pilatotrama ljubarskyi]
MWLLDTETLKLRWFHTPPVLTETHRPADSYAILSHVWEAGGEQTFEVRTMITIHTRCELTCVFRQELNAITAAHRTPLPTQVVEQPDDRPPLSPKVKRLCECARSNGYRYVWDDTCCINKESSAELSEAINSMFDWYSPAEVCYVFLSDVSAAQDPAEKDSAFRQSRWFTRGWTLQELIAPDDVVFLDQDWKPLGTKRNLASIIEEITGIDRGVLSHSVNLDSISVSRRMSWASKRETTRVEDEAYCLLGLFGIHMPTIYGEGHKAFRRLQEEILRRIPDQSIFAWGGDFKHGSPEPTSHTSDSLRSFTPRLS